MLFNFYTNAISRASKNAAGGIFVAGLLLVGFGMMIAAMPEFIGYLVAGLFFVAGIGCTAVAVKIFWSIRKMEQTNNDPTEAYRKNVRIHIENHPDL
jgi:hypothetical protein